MNLLKRIYALLLPDERKKGLYIAGSVFLSALLDFVGLAVLLPVLYYLLEGTKKDEAAFFFCILAAAVIITKCILTTLFIRYQNKSLMAFYKRLSHSLFSSFYRRGLLFIREQGSNKLGYAINSMCYAFSHSLLSPFFRMSGDIMLIFLVTIALLIWNGKSVMLLYASFIPFMCIYIMLIKRRVRKYGENDMNEKQKQARIVMDTFRGFAELEVNGAFPTLQAAFLKGMDKISYNRTKLDTLMRLPMFLTELSVVIGLGLLILFGEGDVKMLVGVFAVASFRLLPALRNILTAWTQIQNSQCCLDAIEEGMKDYEPNETLQQEEITFDHEIRIEDLTYTYPDGSTILEKFNCNIRKGEYIGFKGISGAGKSTLFNILIGLLRPTSGKITIDGTTLSEERNSSWMKQIGYIPQEVFIFNGTLAENIAIGNKNIDPDRINKILHQVSLDKWVKELPDGINTQMSESGSKLSGGQKQRIGIARSLYKQASILMLDEATSALDNETEKEINNTLERMKKEYPGLTILSIAHRNSSLEYCNRIITIENRYEKDI